MIHISAWMDDFLKALEQQFGERVWFVGLQGSYGREEATETSDLDVVVILDTLSASDIENYRTMLDNLPHRDKICGFLSGKQELLCWDTADLFQFCYDTVSIKGSLDEVTARIDDASVDRAIKTAACNLYHGCVHNMLHERNARILRELYKGASFMVQAICYRQTGKYVRHQADLLSAVTEEEKAILETFQHLKQDGEIDFCAMSERLFRWSAKWIKV